MVPLWLCKPPYKEIIGDYEIYYEHIMEGTLWTYATYILDVWVIIYHEMGSIDSDKPIMDDFW